MIRDQYAADTEEWLTGFRYHNDRDPDLKAWNAWERFWDEENESVVVFLEEYKPKEKL